MKPFSLIAALLLGLIALLHVLRLLFAWVVVVNGYAVPLWVSAVAGLFAAVLAALVWREARR